jgi:hypothetical protein
MSAPSSGTLSVRRSSAVVKWLKYLGIAVVGIIALFAGAILAWQKMSDGPYGPLQGGSFKTGEIVSEPITDWSFLPVDIGEIQFELVGFGTSRITGAMIHEGEFYIPCDLGYMWGRFEGRSRFILNVLYIFKHWHTDAEEDGRAILRIDGKLYPGEIVRVTDPGLEATLRHELELMAQRWLAPVVLAPAPTEPPNDIWFFRFESKPEVRPARA